MAIINPGKTVSGAINGTAGNDVIYGSSSDDVIQGLSGNDLIEADAGNDLITGGAGADTFVFKSGWGSDTIVDFTPGLDKLDFSTTSAHGFGSFTVLQIGADLKISYSSDSVLLRNVTATQITFDDIVVNFQDGGAPVSLAEVDGWKNSFVAGPGVSPIGFDRIISSILSDSGLASKIPATQIAAGAYSASALSLMLTQGLNAIGALTDNHVTSDEITALNNWVRSDAQRYFTFVGLHGDDTGTKEWAFHLVQNDGGTSRAFGKNLINTVADGLFHFGFAIQNGAFVNEDGTANATVADVASWVEYYLTDQSTTGNGLDRITDTIMKDPGLYTNISASDILGGAQASNGLNALLTEGLLAVGASTDGWITTSDLATLNAWVRSDANRLAQFSALHGDDSATNETGFHKVQSDGATTQIFNRNFINTVADGIYHFGFAISGDRFLNEDGNANATLSDVAAWLNNLYLDINEITGTAAADVLDGSASRDIINGGGGDDTLNGGAESDFLIGGSGNDLLDGGDGADRIEGGTGNDVYYVDNANDIVIEEATSGTDTVITSIDFRLGANFENLRAKAGASGLTLTGNELANRIYGDTGTDTVDGGAGNDTLDGGAGADTLIGGVGNDVFYVDNVSDAVIEAATGGSDTVYASVNWTIGAGQEVEYLRANAGPTGLTLIGNELANRIYGNTGNDTLDGGAGNDTLDGGAGADALTGGDGNDVFYVDNVSDTVIEAATGGSDTVYASVNWTIGAGQEVEYLRANAGPTGLTLIGNELANRIYGNTGNDTLDGGAGNDVIKGGVGADNLTGSSGSDSFQFSAGDSGQIVGAIDKITDLAKGAVGVGDLIDFSANLAVGGSSAAATSSQASISQTTGVASFDVTSGTTLADALSDIAVRFTAATDTAGEFALFKVNGTGDFYLLISDGAAGVTTNDVVVQLVGVIDISSINLTGGNITIAG